MARASLLLPRALLQSGVSYVAGYQGAPISHLMDVLADANPILMELGVRFEHSASEATAAATLAASVNYPLRGAITFKSTVGTNVASDALANLASGGVTGGALIIVGEDYGEGSSIMQERSHAFAMKSQMWLLDPRPNLPSIVSAVESGFQLSEASNTPVMLELRIRACHVHGSFIAKDNVRSSFSLRDAMEQPVRDVNRIVLPPASFMHEEEKIRHRWPAAQRFVQEQHLNEFFGEDGEVGIMLQGGLYNTVMRSLYLLGVADIFGESKLPLYVLNVTYPIVDKEVKDFCAGKRAVLIIEEGQPNFIEQNLRSILHEQELPTKLHGKDMLPKAGEYTATALLQGILSYLRRYRPDLLNEAALPAMLMPQPPRAAAVEESRAQLSPRPAAFCTGCPERPIFTAMKLVGARVGRAPHQLRYRMSPVFSFAAVQPGRDNNGLRARFCGRRCVQHA